MAGDALDVERPLDVRGSPGGLREEEKGERGRRNPHGDKLIGRSRALLKKGKKGARINAKVNPPEDHEPFDETAVTRGRRRCYFCESDKSDEWRFLARLNAFICQACQQRVESLPPPQKESKQPG